MVIRKIASLVLAISFIILLITGLLFFATPYSRVTATLHTFFGWLFTIGVLFHLSKNFRNLKGYTNSRIIYPVLIGVTLLGLGAFLQIPPFRNIMDFGARLKSEGRIEINPSQVEVVNMDLSKEIQISIDLKRSVHYWHPQMAVWTENMDGSYRETLFVTEATAKGVFFGGRNKSNFKTFDREKSPSGEFRRVDALPVWSHSRGVQYEDGMFSPSSKRPLPDAITGATISNDFILNLSMDKQSQFVLNLELNVAFDDNEFYSEYDFPQDDVFHNGTGQLGQPSIIYKVHIDMNDDKEYYLMDLKGHGHHSARDGEIYPDVSSLTTALEIVERIVVKANYRYSIPS